MACSACVRPAGSSCPARAVIGKFDRMKDERLRVQVSAIEILRHEVDAQGNPDPLARIECTREEEIEAVVACAEVFPRFWNKGLRCPNEVAKRIEAIVQSPNA